MKQLYDQVPPKRTKNTLLGDIAGSPVIKENFIFKRSQHFTTKKGGNEWVLLCHHLGTGVYIVWCTVESKKMSKNPTPLCIILIFQNGMEKSILVLFLSMI